MKSEPPKEIFVEINNTISQFLVSKCDVATAKHLKLLITERHYLQPSAFILLSSNADILLDSSPIHHSMLVRVQFVGCVQGGKGGFGALLRSMSKKKGVKTTQDFGACRDLNGRRIRHVNDEIVMRKWKESKEKGEEFDVDQKTASGIDLWFLSTPTWAEKVSKKRRRNLGNKTRLCLDWLRARENGQPPADCPPWWGCPRGRNCEFAHGDDELRGSAAEELQIQRQRDETDEKEAYVSSSKVVTDDADVAELIETGLQAQKRQRDEPIDNGAILSDESEGDNPPHWLGVICGSVRCKFSRISGTSEFSTIIIGKETDVRNGDWYYEIRLMTDGIIQVGWANADFLEISRSADDGVGDDIHSWAFDGNRSLKWHSTSESYGSNKLQLSDGWDVGDVVGCRIQVIPSDEPSVRTIIMSFYLNGISLGVAFEFNSECLLYPAISLNGGEEIEINIGDVDYSHPLLSSRSLFSMYESAKPQVISKVPGPCTDSTDGMSATPCAEKAEIDIESPKFEDVSAIEALGLDTLKFLLSNRGLKSSGTLAERAARLHACRGLTWEQIEKKYKAKIDKQY